MVSDQEVPVEGPRREAALLQKRHRAGQLRLKYRQWREAMREVRARYCIVYPRLIERLLAQNALKESAKLVGVLLVLRADAVGEVRLKVTEIAQQTGLSERTVQGALAELEQDGFIERIQFTGNGLWHLFLGPYAPVPGRD